MRPRRIPVRTAPAPAPKPPAPEPHFRSRADRADCCSAQALVEVRLPSDRVLWLCGHHYRRHEAALTAHGAQITADDRPLLTKPYEGIER